MKDDGLWLEILSRWFLCGISVWLHMDWMATLGICWELWRYEMVFGLVWIRFLIDVDHHTIGCKWPV